MLRRGSLAVASLVVSCAAGVPIAMAASPQKLERRCQAKVGDVAVKCLRDYSDAVGECRDAADTGCEDALHADDGRLADVLAAVADPMRKVCTDASAERISVSLGVERHIHYIAEGCEKWAEYLLDAAYADDLTNVSPEALACQRRVAPKLGTLRDKVLAAAGACYVAEFAGRTCDRDRREQKIAKALTAARRGILGRCGTVFDQLALVGPEEGVTLEARVDALLGRVTLAARHFALRVYPPLNLGPTALPGPTPVGVRTLEIVDESRQNPAGTGPRTLTVEVYYPSTAEAVAGVPRDVVQVFGIELFPTPTYRDVARAAGPFPVIVYSHGSGGIRFESLALFVHLASHGYVVLSADHPGDTLLDPGDDMTAVLTNRPRDVSFLLDTFLGFNSESGNFFAGALDADHIGATGWSYGGYTALALAAGSFSLGTFTDPRVKAIMPLDGSAQVFDPDVPALYPTITIPTLLLGASLTEVIAPRLQQMFDGLPDGAAMVAYGNFLDAVHPSFVDNCEAPEVLRGVSPACEPPVVPWRHVRHIENYLALNFFDGSLIGNTDALARLDPAMLADVEELAYQRK